MNPRCKLAWTALLLAGACFGPARADAQWLPGGTAIGVAPLDFELRISAVPDGSGGAFVLWMRNDMTQARMFMLQHLHSTGTLAPGWPTEGIELLPADQAATIFGMLSDGAGGFYLGLSDLSSHRVYRFDPNGEPATGWPASGVFVGYVSCELCFSREIKRFMLGGTASGCHVIDQGSVVDVRGGPTSYHYAVTRISASGHVDGTAVYCTEGPHDGAFCADGHGGVIGFITDPCTGLRKLLVWPETGSPEWSPVDSLRSGQTSVACDIHGGPWLIGCPYAPQGQLRVQRVAPDGTPLSGWEAGVELPARAAAGIAIPDLVGGILFLWVGTGPIARGLRVNGDGSIPSGWDPAGVVATPGSSTQFGFQAVPDGNGGAFLAWLKESGNSAPGLNASVTRLLENGSIDPSMAPGGRDVSLRPLGYSDLLLVATEPGAAMVFWAEIGDGISSIYAQRLPLDQATPVLASLLRADADAERVQVAWRVSPASRSVGLQRRIEPFEWAGLATLVPDGVGEVAFEDREVSPGARVGYRLLLGDGSNAGETWLTVPRTKLVLAGFAPNPSTASARLSFTLAGDGPATIDVLDVSGRRVFASDITRLGPGEHQLELAPGSRLAPGVYVIRLTQGRSMLTARGVVLR